MNELACVMLLLFLLFCFLLVKFSKPVSKMNEADKKRQQFCVWGITITLLLTFILAPTPSEHTVSSNNTKTVCRIKEGD